MELKKKNSEQEKKIESMENLCAVSQGKVVSLAGEMESLLESREGLLKGFPPFFSDVIP